MSPKRAVFTGRNVVLSDGQPRAATVIADVESGKIVEILDRLSVRTDFPDVDDALWMDAGNQYILPGIVEYVCDVVYPHHVTNRTFCHTSAHVHLNEPGRTDWEGFWTGTRAAASGGVTTVVDMPLNSIPPTTSVANLEEKLNAARGQCWTDVAFWGGVIPGNQVDHASIPLHETGADSRFRMQAHLNPLVNAGVRGFKCFLIESGVDVSIMQGNSIGHSDRHTCTGIPVCE